jgi:hypothetical protein
MILVRLLNLRFLNEHAAMTDRNLKFAALVLSRTHLVPLSPGARRVALRSAAGSCSPLRTPALTPLPNRPQQYPEQREACGKTKREVDCVGVNHVGAPRKQSDFWGSGGTF